MIIHTIISNSRISASSNHSQVRLPPLLPGEAVAEDEGVSVGVGVLVLVEVPDAPVVPPAVFVAPPDEGPEVAVGVGVGVVVATPAGSIDHVRV